MHRIIYVVLILTNNLFLEQQHFNIEELSLFSDIMLFSKLVTMVTTKISQLYFRCVKTIQSIKFYVGIRPTDRNIQDCLLLSCAFIISDITQSIVFQFVQNL